MNAGALFRKNPLYLITDPVIAGMPHAQIARTALDAGVSVIQVRDKILSKKQLFHEVVRVRSLLASSNAVLIINDYVDIACAVNADGVHLGQEDMPLPDARRIMGAKKLIGISTHNLRQALRAEEEGADYIGFGPIFATDTKNAGPVQGPETLARIRKRVTIPIVAIGGISWDRARSVLDAGADAVAVASGILTGNIGKNVQRYFSAL